MIIYSGELEHRTIKITSTHSNRCMRFVCVFECDECRDLFLDKAKSGNMSMTLTISIWIVYLIDATCSTMKFIICLYGKQINYSYVCGLCCCCCCSCSCLASVKSTEQISNMCLCFHAHTLKKCHLISRTVTNMQIPIKKISWTRYAITLYHFSHISKLSRLFMSAPHFVREDSIKCSNCNWIKRGKRILLKNERWARINNKNYGA